MDTTTTPKTIEELQKQREANAADYGLNPLTEKMQQKREGKETPLTIPESFRRTKCWTMTSQGAGDPASAHSLTENEIQKYNAIHALEKEGVRYLVTTRVLGSGGLGIVYEAFDVQQTRQVVAIKFNYNSDPVLFKKEVTAMIQASGEPFAENKDSKVDEKTVINPYIVPVYNYVKNESLGWGLVMKKMEQPTLKALVNKEGGVPPKGLVQIITDIALGADSMWRSHHLLHLDLKPSNVFVDQDWHCKLTDFGLSSVSTEIGRDHFGTPAYMSPERARGAANVLIDTRSEVFTLASITYFLLTGKNLLDNDDPIDTALQLITDDISAKLDVQELIDAMGTNKNRKSFPLEILQEIVKVMKKALQKDPGERYATPTEYAVALKRALERIPETEPELLFEEKKHIQPVETPLQK